MASRGPGVGSSLRSTDKASRVMKNTASGEDELAVVISDVTKPPRPKIQRTLPSMFANPRTPSTDKTSQQAASPATKPSQPSPRMQLAVHIRSSQATPFTPINASPSRGPSALPSSLSRTQERPAASRTPPGPSTSDATAGPRVNAGVPGSDPKKRGRPKGWKPGTPYTTDPNSRYRRREMKAAESQTPGKSTRQAKDQGQNQEVKRRGRPPRPLTPSAREQYLQSTPDYIPYKCEWALSEGSPQQEPAMCPAELQNMDTLRRHVRLVHGAQVPLVCRFPRCRDRDPPLHFKTRDEFAQHMETKHFAVYLWYLGEGYHNNGVGTPKGKADNKLPAYLFDQHGNQVTPSVTNQKLETDLQRKERKRKLRELLYQQNENAPSEEEWMQQMLGIINQQ